MRVLAFTNLFPNGADPTFGVFIYQRIVHLSRRAGNFVEVVAPVPFFPRWLPAKRWSAVSQLPATERIGPLTVHHPRYFLLPKISMPLHGLFMYWGSLPLVRKLHAEKKFDCIDAHFVYPDGFAAVLLGRRLGIPVMVSARGTDINSYPSHALIRPMVRWTLRKAAACVAVSAALKEKMTEVCGEDISIHTIPNGVDTDRFWRTDIGEAREALSLSKTNRLIVAVGSLTETKRHQLLIRAIRGIAPRYPGIQLFIFGEGPCRDALERLVQELGLVEQVHLPGKIPNETLRLWFSAADLSCLTSAREGWPNVVTESLACGTPVVATRVGGIPEILHSPELGVLVEETPESLAAGLEQALSRSWNREAISRQTRARTWDVVATEVEEVLMTQIPKRADRTVEV